MTIQTTTRNAGLAELKALLEDHRVRRHDVIVPAVGMGATAEGMVTVANAAQIITEDGVTSAAGLYQPTETADEGLAAKLGIPPAYVRRMREQRPDLWAANINGWLHGSTPAADPWAGSEVYGEGADRCYPADPRSFLLRLLKADDEGRAGVLRAVLSNSYQIIDNLDVLVAALGGVRDSGIAINPGDITCDLSDRRMYVRITAKEVAAMAPALLSGYRNPFAGAGVDEMRRWQQVARREGLGYEPGSEPVVWAGLEISNSETGNGAFSITPRLEVEICKNGLKIKADALRAVHLGARQDDGLVQWSADTQEKTLALIMARSRDAVKTFLNAEYVAAKVAELERDAGVPVTDAPAVIKEVTAKATFPNELADDILGFFIRGGQTTAGGVMQAVTAAAQVQSNADTAAEMEAAAVPVLAHAAAIARRAS